MTSTKTCSCCGLAKPWNPDPAVRHKKASGFYAARCWACFIEAAREASRRWLENPENREASRKATRRYHSTPEGHEAKLEATRRWYQTPEGRAYAKEASRRRRKPKDWDEEAIKAIEAQAKQQGLGTDHIFAIKAVDPKTGLRASGLHRSWNLQILSAAENKSKGNRCDFAQEERRLMEQSRAIIPASTLLATGALPR